jgi:hypothetical protein
LTGRRQKIVGHVDQQAQIAGGVFAQRLDERRAQQFGIAGGFEQMRQTFLERFGREGFQAQAAANAAGDGQPVSSSMSWGGSEGCWP